MDQTAHDSPAPKARRLRRMTLMRGRHQWVFVCEAGEEAQLVRFAAEVLERERVPLRRLHVAVLARQMGLLPEGLNPTVRKAD